MLLPRVVTLILISEVLFMNLVMFGTTKILGSYIFNWFNGQMVDGGQETIVKRAKHCLDVIIISIIMEIIHQRGQMKISMQGKTLLSLWRHMYFR